ncbi:ABC transporter permease [Planomicrobium sp. CPCC 101079]|nr:ABC transporter permease [Planomicrobium sp. CPCC 101079]
MLKLMQNEWMKLWSKKASWMMVFLLVVILFASAAITKYVNSTANEGIEESWQNVVAAQQEANQAMLMDPNMNEAQKDYYTGQIAIAEYRLENDVQPFEFTSMQQSVLDAHEMLSLVTLFTVVIAAGITASEFSQGTIKMLLTRPVRRWKVLTSKYLTTMVFAGLLSVITLLAAALAGLVFFGIGEGTFLVWTGSEVMEGSYWREAIKLSVLSFASVWIIGTFAFMLGTVFRSSSLAIGLSIFLMFTGIQAVFLLSNYEIIKYYLFTHTDLTQFYSGFMPVPDITMTMSLIVLFVYFLLFLGISYWTFSKRDITA